MTVKHFYKRSISKFICQYFLAKKSGLQHPCRIITILNKGNALFFLMKREIYFSDINQFAIRSGYFF